MPESPEQRLAHELGHQKALGGIRHLIALEEERRFRKVGADQVQQGVEVLVLEGRSRHNAEKGTCLSQQVKAPDHLHFGRGVALVEQNDGAGFLPPELLQDRLLLFGDRLLGFREGFHEPDQEVVALQRFKRVLVHALVELPGTRMDAGGVNEHHLHRLLRADTPNAVAGGLRLGGDDRDGLPDQAVEQSRLAHVGTSNETDEPATGFRRLGWGWGGGSTGHLRVGLVRKVSANSENAQYRG